MRTVLILSLNSTCYEKAVEINTVSTAKASNARRSSPNGTIALHQHKKLPKPQSVLAYPSEKNNITPYL